MQQILIVGSGFAGTWAALAAARAADLAGKTDQVGVTVISPEAALHMRPRLYEASLEGMAPALGPLLESVGVRHVAGAVTSIDAGARRVNVALSGGDSGTLAYDRLVLATGSQVATPALPGLAAHGFDVDQLASARALDAHLQRLVARPPSVARDTVVVIGGGFTGIETAAEMPARLRGILGPDSHCRVVLIEHAPVLGPELGDVPRPHIESALAICGVEIRTGTAVTAITADSVSLADGGQIAAATVIWTAGMRAHPLAATIGSGHDKLGRAATDGYLHALGSDGIFVCGDVARAAVDDAGNVAPMSCQHALSLGRVAGYNAAAELLGLPLHRYSQPKYVTCLDLGAWGALYTEGWDRQVFLTGADGKALKRQINTEWIYPPKPERGAVFAVANPDYVIVP